MGDGEHAIPEVMEMLEAELTSGPAGINSPGAQREQLTVLVSTGKANDAIGVQRTHEQMKRLSDKDVEKYFKGTRHTLD